MDEILYGPEEKVSSLKNKTYKPTYLNRFLNCSLIHFSFYLLLVVFCAGHLRISLCVVLCMTEYVTIKLNLMNDMILSGIFYKLQSNYNC